MPVKLDQYRGVVGAFNSHSKKFYISISIRMLDDVLPITSAFPSILLAFIMFLLFSKSFCFTILLGKNIKIMDILLLRIIHIYALATYVFHIWLYLILIKRSGDCEQNPGPKSNSFQGFSICHWNLNSISAHNFIKISLLKTYIATHKLDVIRLSETYLDSSISNDDDNLEISGYDLFRADNRSNTKRGGVCIYYRNSLPLKILNIQYLHECINFEIRIGGKLCRSVSLYRSPSQSQDDFESFANNFELNIDTATAHNTFLTVVLGDFNAKSNLWFKGDKTTHEGSTIDGITSTFGLQQIINEPTHIIGDSSSCIDLILTSQPNLVIESELHSTLHPNGHHEIVYAKFNLKIYYPPPYERETWHYEKTSVDHIRMSIDEFS